MKKPVCGRCGNKALLRGFASVRCPICGEYGQTPDAGTALLWSEHRLGLLFRKDGWRWLGEAEPPAWFLENVV